MKNSSTLILGLQILEAFEREMVPKAPKYREGWRYKNLKRAIDDLIEIDSVREIYDVGNLYPFCGDELYGDLAIKATRFQGQIEEIFNERTLLQNK